MIRLKIRESGALTPKQVMNNRAQQQLLKIVNKNLSATKKAIAEGRISKEVGIKGYANKAAKATDKDVANMWRWAGRDLTKSASTLEALKQQRSEQRMDQAKHWALLGALSEPAFNILTDSKNVTPKKLLTTAAIGGIVGAGVGAVAYPLSHEAKENKRRIDYVKQLDPYFDKSKRSV